MEFFELEEYDEYNWKHRSTVIALCNDDNVRRYFYDFDRYVTNIVEHGKDNGINKAYIVLKKDKIVGMIMIDYLDYKYYISYALLPSKRHENLGTVLLGDFIEYLFQINADINNVYLEINASNIASIKTALNVGFVKDGKTSYHMSNFYKNRGDK